MLASDRSQLLYLSLPVLSLKRSGEVPWLERTSEEQHLSGTVLVEAQPMRRVHTVSDPAEMFVSQVQ